jgi:hypothetical protein
MEGRQSPAEPSVSAFFTTGHGRSFPSICVRQPTASAARHDGARMEFIMLPTPTITTLSIARLDIGYRLGLGVIGGVSAVRSAADDELSAFKARRVLGGLPAAEAGPDDIGGLDRLRSVHAQADLHGST